MNTKYPFEDEYYEPAPSKKKRAEGNNVTVMKVIGIGGAGCNAINRMIEDGIRNVDFIAVNTDLQVLNQSLASNKMQIGSRTTRGLGAGARPEVGEKAAQEDVEEIRSLLEGTDMVFITAGMGGGTGTGAAPIFARTAKDLGALTVAVVTLPFEWEGQKRFEIAQEGIERLKEHVDTLLVISNSRIFKVIESRTSFKAAFKRIDDVLKQAVEGISTIIGETGIINVDFADVRTVLSNKGEAIMGIGMANGDNRAIEAAKMALENPLIENSSFRNAGAILVNIIASDDFTMRELDEASHTIAAFCRDDAQRKFGVTIDPNLKDKIKIIIVATDFQKAEPKKYDERMAAEDIFEPKKVVPLSEMRNRQREKGNESPTRFRVFSQREEEENNSDYHHYNEGDPNNLEIPAFLRRGKRRQTG